MLKELFSGASNTSQESARVVRISRGFFVFRVFFLHWSYHLILILFSAEELLTSELLPRKIELEERYLEEALEILTSSQVCSFYFCFDFFV